MSLVIHTVTTKCAGPKRKKPYVHSVATLLDEKEIVPSFMTIVLVDARFRDDIEGESIDPISKPGNTTSAVAAATRDH